MRRERLPKASAHPCNRGGGSCTDSPAARRQCDTTQRHWPLKRSATSLARPPTTRRQSTGHAGPVQPIERASLSTTADPVHREPYKEGHRHPRPHEHTSLEGKSAMLSCVATRTTRSRIPNFAACSHCECTNCAWSRRLALPRRTVAWAASNAPNPEGRPRGAPRARL